MPWRDLSDQERAEIKADAWTVVSILCAGLCALAAWYYFGRTG